MPEHSVVIVGLPESGKTTFLGALWHLVFAREIETVLRFQNLLSGNSTHLNAIAARWREARMQDRTAVGGDKLVSMNLADTRDAVARVTFPDIAGESYRRMWEERTCDPNVAEVLRSGNVMFFIHADTIRQPQWVVDEVELSRKLGLQVSAEDEVPWHPRLAPTQVQVVGILQLLHEPPLDIGPRRLAIMLSAWDKVSDEGLEPTAFLERGLPLLAQYLRHNGTEWNWRVYGLSAQGGDYDSTTANGPSNAAAEALRKLDYPSTRIRLVTGQTDTHDLTEPLAWLME